jgi:hypothetical protein
MVVLLLGDLHTKDISQLCRNCGWHEEECGDVRRQGAILAQRPSEKMLPVYRWIRYTVWNLEITGAMPVRNFKILSR